jgi:hypothetical protein
LSTLLLPRSPTSTSLTMAPEAAPPVAEVLDPFKSHLVALLSIYELGPFPGAPIPRYEGPTDWQTETILRSLAAVAQRMWRAEAVVSEFKDARSQLVSTLHPRLILR